MRHKDIEGRWVIFKDLRQDGSKIIDRFDDGTSFMEILIKNGQYCIQFSSIESNF